MPNPIGAVAGGLSLLGNIANMIAARKQTKDNMKELNALGTRTIDPYAEKQMAFAQNLYNGRMAGAAREEANIFQNQANTTGAVQQNATDSSQALAVIAGLQGASNSSFADLAAKEAQDKQARASMVIGAQNTMIDQGGKVWDDRLRMFKDKLGIRSVGVDNFMKGVNGIAGSLSQVAGGVMNKGWLPTTTKAGEGK